MKFQDILPPLLAGEKVSRSWPSPDSYIVLGFRGILNNFGAFHKFNFADLTALNWEVWQDRPLEISASYTYRLRNGDMAYIANCNPDALECDYWVGWVGDDAVQKWNKGILTWYKNGRRQREGLHKFDIVECLLP